MKQKHITYSVAQTKNLGKRVSQKILKSLANKEQLLLLSKEI